MHDAVVYLVTPVDKIKHQHGPGCELAGAARSVGHFVWGAQLEAKHGQIQKTGFATISGVITLPILVGSKRCKSMVEFEGPQDASGK